MNRAWQRKLNSSNAAKYKKIIHRSIVLRTNHRKIEMRLFILYNLQLEIINFLYKNYRTAASWPQPFWRPHDSYRETAKHGHLYYDR